MLKKSLAVALVVACAACYAGTAAADIVCADSSYCVVNFATTVDRINVVPNGSGDTFAAAGITITVYLKNCSGAPLVGVPRQEIVLYNSALCICPGGNVADAATDTNGATTFSGSLAAGGCVTSLQCYADGVLLCTLPVKTKGPDHVAGVSACKVDGSDFSSFATVFGVPANYNVCYDYVDSGLSAGKVDGSDLSYFAARLTAACQ